MRLPLLLRAGVVLFPLVALACVENTPPAEPDPVVPPLAAPTEAPPPVTEPSAICSAVRSVSAANSASSTIRRGVVSRVPARRRASATSSMVVNGRRALDGATVTRPIVRVSARIPLLQATLNCRRASA